MRAWLEEHHAQVDVLWIGFWKVHTGRQGLTYVQAVDEALCFGWINGLKKRRDDETFVQRFTPRRALLVDEPGECAVKRLAGCPR